jgi:23S rRNA pseudouridine1911/1915/1917 synthase
MKKITIKEDEAGRRIDKFLKKEFFSYSRGDIIKKIKMGEVLVNNEKIKPSYELKIGDEIQLELSQKKENLFLNSEIKLNIIYEDSQVIVIDKEANIQVHPGYNEKENTLVNALVYNFPEIISIGDGSADSWLRPGIVHRLDKETSGVLIVARTQEAFDELKEKFKNREIEKKYLAITWGKFLQKKGIIDKALAKSADHKKQIIANERTKTKTRDAVTEYSVSQEFKNYSLVEVFPKTGRTHQIRAHLASIGNPIVGDKIYGLNMEKPKIVKVKRQMLHAEKLKLELFGKKYSFKSAIPDDFKKFLKHIDEK